MFGREGEQLERLRLQRRQQYASDLKQQIESHNPQSTFRTSASNQILNDPLSARRSSDQQTSSRYYQQQSRPSYVSDNQNQQTHDSYNSYQNYNSHSYDDDILMQRVQSMIDRSLSSEVSSQMRRYSDQMNSLSTKVDNSIMTSQNSIQTIRDKLSEITLNINSINQKVSDNNDKIVKEISALRQDTVRINDTFQSKIQNIESSFAQLSESISNISNRQHEFEVAIGNQVSQLSSLIASVSRSSSEADQQLAKQVEGLNRQTISTFTQMGSQIQSVSNAMYSSFSSIINETKNSLDTVRKETDNSIALLEQEAQKNSQNILNAIGSLQEEVVSTIGAVSSFTKSSIEASQNAIIAEHENRTSNEQKMLESYNAFTVSIAEQISQNRQTVEKLESNQRAYVEQQCTNYLSLWKTDLSAFLKEVSSTVCECKSHQTELERKLNEYVVSVGKRQDEILEIVNKSTSPEVLSSNLQILNDRITLLENQLQGILDAAGTMNERSESKSSTKSKSNTSKNSSIHQGARRVPNNKPFRPPAVKLPNRGPKENNPNRNQQQPTQFFQDQQSFNNQFNEPHNTSIQNQSNTQGNNQIPLETTNHKVNISDMDTKSENSRIDKSNADETDNEIKNKSETENETETKYETESKYETDNETETKNETDNTQNDADESYEYEYEDDNLTESKTATPNMTKTESETYEYDNDTQNESRKSSNEYYSEYDTDTNYNIEDSQSNNKQTSQKPPIQSQIPKKSAGGVQKIQSVKQAPPSVIYPSPKPAPKPKTDNSTYNRFQSLSNKVKNNPNNDGRPFNNFNSKQEQNPAELDEDDEIPQNYPPPGFKRKASAAPRGWGAKKKNDSKKQPRQNPQTSNMNDDPFSMNLFDNSDSLQDPSIFKKI